jgi:8-oxo-dGTP diphosphatase
MLPRRSLLRVDEIQAAGGIVRRGETIAVVHRPKYDDWSLPKGKLDAGESFEDAALREVEEETGARATLVRELEPVRYMTPGGRSKIVRYWVMDAGEDDAFEADQEVDDIRWVSPEEARELLSYDNDRGLLDQL